MGFYSFAFSGKCRPGAQEVGECLGVAVGEAQVGDLGRLVIGDADDDGPGLVDWLTGCTPLVFWAESGDLAVSSRVASNSVVFVMAVGFSL